MEESARAMLQRSRLAQQLQQQNAADDCDLQEDEHDGYSAPAHGQEQQQQRQVPAKGSFPTPQYQTNECSSGVYSSGSASAMRR
eukprot:3361-Heterococcus_DN1.PRE.2